MEQPQHVSSALMLLELSLVIDELDHLLLANHLSFHPLQEEITVVPIQELVLVNRVIQLLPVSTLPILSVEEFVTWLQQQ